MQSDHQLVVRTLENRVNDLQVAAAAAEAAHASTIEGMRGAPAKAVAAARLDALWQQEEAARERSALRARLTELEFASEACRRDAEEASARERAAQRELSDVREMLRQVCLCALCVHTICACHTLFLLLGGLAHATLRVPPRPERRWTRRCLACVLQLRARRQLR